MSDERVSDLLELREHVCRATKDVRPATEPGGLAVSACEAPCAPPFSAFERAFLLPFSNLFTTIHLFVLERLVIRSSKCVIETATHRKTRGEEIGGNVHCFYPFHNYYY